MCGIVGYVGEQQASEILIPALRRLEYRGYDSSGIATLSDGEIKVRRSIGKLVELEKILHDSPIGGTIGIGHTRWATHGRVSEQNAHPHKAGRVVLIHNGIIENFIELRQELTGRGRKILSETDTEIVSHLIDEAMEGGASLIDAVRWSVQRLKGSFSIVVASPAEPGRLVAAKTATPIVIGVGKGENFIASDIPALLDHTRDVLFLEDGEIAEITREEARITSFAGEVREREPRRITWDPVTAQKGGYKHFLLKEIHEQPQAVIDTVRGRSLVDAGDVSLGELDDIRERLEKIERVTLVACGTAWHACLVGKFFLNDLCRIPADVDYGSEFRYRTPVLGEKDLLIVVSQSGETADTLGGLEAAQAQGALGIAICNVVDSSIARRADAVIYTHAGPEISVCSTKTFTTQLSALFLFGLHYARMRGTMSADEARLLLIALNTIPAHIERSLVIEPEIEKLASTLLDAEDFLFLGRGINYPIALEGALKLKEICYIHAEGYPAGEMKHGPIALITSELPVVILAPRDPVFAKTISNMKEIESRGGRIIVITDGPTKDFRNSCSDALVVPRTHPLLTPFLLTLPLQLLAYYVAVGRGTDIDQPRNLAKSVTVE